MMGQAMSGITRCTVPILTGKFPLALHVHCASHCLNLSLNVASICNMMKVT